MSRRFTAIPISDEARDHIPDDYIKRATDYAANSGWFEHCPVRWTYCGEPPGRWGDNYTVRRIQDARR